MLFVALLWVTFDSTPMVQLWCVEREVGVKSAFWVTLFKFFISNWRLKGSILQQPERLTQQDWARWHRRIQSYLWLSYFRGSSKSERVCCLRYDMLYAVGSFTLRVRTYLLYIITTSLFIKFQDLWVTGQLYVDNLLIMDWLSGMRTDIYLVVNHQSLYHLVIHHSAQFSSIKLNSSIMITVVVMWVQQSQS